MKVLGMMCGGAAAFVILQRLNEPPNPWFTPPVLFLLALGAFFISTLVFVALDKKLSDTPSGMSDFDARLYGQLMKDEKDKQKHDQFVDEHDREPKWHENW